ncbi:hypothetical protein B0H14DRAFT_401379 [Mycena olivaceomarginata]|nr:hypothetical protein B0H14DRAFT_401379 [Mycena olivaceomarginata]
MSRCIFCVISCFRLAGPRLCFSSSPRKQPRDPSYDTRPAYLTMTEHHTEEGSKPSVLVTGPRYSLAWIIRGCFAVKDGLDGTTIDIRRRTVSTAPRARHKTDMAPTRYGMTPTACDLTPQVQLHDKKRPQAVTDDIRRGSLYGISALSFFACLYPALGFPCAISDMNSPTFTYPVAPHGHRAGPGHGHGQPRNPPQYAYAPHGARSPPAAPPACTNSNQKQKHHTTAPPPPAACDPPPPYSSKLFAPSTGTQKHRPAGSEGRWNPFARKHRSPAEGGGGVNPRGLQAEMLDPEDRAW